MPEEIRPPLISRLPRWVWVLLDCAVAAIMALGYSGLVGYRTGGEPGLFLTASALITTLPLALRRLWPTTVFVLVVAGGLGMQQFLSPGVDLICLPLALYAVAGLRSRAIGVVALFVSLGVGLRGEWDLPVTASVRNNLALVAAVVVAAWAAGALVRERRLYTGRLAVHAEERARAQAAEERLRIARELHDVVGHSLSTIAVQAGVAGHLGEAAEMSRALASIEETSRSALGETRRLLGVLRDDGDADLAPVPGLGDLPALVERTRAAGIEVELTTTGEVPDELGLTIYRIVQEALTNVIKHAEAGHAWVAVSHADGTTCVEVTDDGLRARHSAFGHGLSGLRERVRVFGGEFEAGPRPPRGFRVLARVPA